MDSCLNFQMIARITSLFRLKIFLLVNVLNLQIEGWPTGVVHGPGVHVMFSIRSCHCASLPSCVFSFFFFFSRFDAI